MNESLSSLQCVAAFRVLGFEITRVSERRVTLSNGARTFTIPRHRSLDPADVRLLLHLARVDEARFREATTRHASGTITLERPPADVRASGDREPT